MMEQIFEVTFTTHIVKVRRYADDDIVCWKFVSRNDEVMVDFCVFTTIDAAVEYIVKPMDILQWKLVVYD